MIRKITEFLYYFLFGIRIFIGTNVYDFTPEYWIFAFKILFEKYGLTADDVVYFEHNAEAAKTAQSVGITTYFYDHTKEDMDALKQFLDENL